VIATTVEKVIQKAFIRHVKSLTCFYFFIRRTLQEGQE
jgi:hypothetical protein